MKTIHVLISAWVAVAVIGLGTAAPAFVSANNSLAAVAGIGIAGASIFALYKLSLAIYAILNQEASE